MKKVKDFVLEKEEPEMSFEDIQTMYDIKHREISMTNEINYDLTRTIEAALPLFDIADSDIKTKAKALILNAMSKLTLQSIQGE